MECEIDAEYYREYIDPDSIFRLNRGDKKVLVMFLEVSEEEFWIVSSMMLIK
jgi:hypothetical protein